MDERELVEVSIPFFFCVRIYVCVCVCACVYVSERWTRSHIGFAWYGPGVWGSEYHNPRNQSFGVLRVMNDDLVQPARGFGEHPHRDVEICTYIVEGALTHKDSMGTEETLTRGAVQVSPSLALCLPTHFICLLLSNHSHMRLLVLFNVCARSLSLSLSLSVFMRVCARECVVTVYVCGSSSS
jgi:hypothetical protein